MNALPEKGDTVRVVLEGDVSWVNKDRFQVGHDLVANVVYPDAEHVKSIEVLSKPVKVGDVIQGEDAYKALPAHSVVKRHSDGVLVKQADGKWFDSKNLFSVSYPASTRELIYLPD